MKILILIDTLDIGGAESHVEVLATELRYMGHEVIVASAGGKGQKNKSSGSMYKCLHGTLRGVTPRFFACGRAVQRSDRLRHIRRRI